MDVTVSELLELFLQSPLVTWVSAGGRGGEAASGAASAQRGRGGRLGPPAIPTTPLSFLPAGENLRGPGERGRGQARRLHGPGGWRRPEQNHAANVSGLPREGWAVAPR